MLYFVGFWIQVDRWSGCVKSGNQFFLHVQQWVVCFCVRAARVFFFPRGKINKSRKKRKGSVPVVILAQLFFVFCSLCPLLLIASFRIKPPHIHCTHPSLSFTYHTLIHSPIMSQRPKATRAETSEMEMPPTTLSKKQFQQVEKAFNWTRSFESRCAMHIHCPEGGSCWN